MNIEKWGNFGNPDEPAFWIVLVSANALSLLLLLGLLLWA